MTPVRFYDPDTGRFVQAMALAFTGPAATTSLLTTLDTEQYRRQRMNPNAGLDDRSGLPTQREAAE